MSVDAIRIEPYSEGFRSQVIDLILSIQRDEFGLAITIEDQPDLMEIPEFYQTGNGNFWLALDDGRVVGTIALIDIGDKQGALRKMFVHHACRGGQPSVASRLLVALLTWCRQRGVGHLYLGTTSKYLAAHRFYEKNDFSEISKNQLPAAFPVMAVDSKFYHLKIDTE